MSNQEEQWIQDCSKTREEKERNHLSWVTVHDLEIEATDYKI